MSHRSYQAPHGSQLQPSHNLSLPKCRLCFQQPKRIRPDRASKHSPFPQFRTPVVLRQDGKKILPSLPSALHSLNPSLCCDSQAEGDFPLQFDNKLYTLQGEEGAWSPSWRLQGKKVGKVRVSLGSEPDLPRQVSSVEEKLTVAEFLLLETCLK